MPSGDTEQRQYWNQLVELKFAVNYLQAYHGQYDRNQTTLAVGLAIAGNGSIAAWVIWKDYPMVWACIIAASQLVTAIKAWLPWERRLKPVVAAKREIEAVFFAAETRWYSVREGLMTSPEIHQAVMDIKQQRARVEATHFDSSPLPDVDGHIRSARERTELYFADYTS